MQPKEKLLQVLPNEIKALVSFVRSLSPHKLPPSTEYWDNAPEEETEFLGYQQDSSLKT